MSEDHNMAGQAGSEPDRIVKTGPREITVFTKRGIGGKDFRGRRDNDPKAPVTSAQESAKPSTSKKQTVPASLPPKGSPASAEKVQPPLPAPAPSSTDKTSPGSPTPPAAPATAPQE